MTQQAFDQLHTGLTEALAVARGWNHDLSQAPRGKMVPYTRKGKDGPVQAEQYRKEYILAVDEHGVVSQSYWIPPRYTQSGGLLEGNRWSGFNPGFDPIAWAPWPEYQFATAPGDAAVTLGNDLREPVAAEQGQIIREGDAPRETDRASGVASGPDTYQPEKATKSGVGPLPGAAGADGTHKPAEDERSVEAAGGASLVLTHFILEDVGGGA